MADSDQMRIGGCRQVEEHDFDECGRCPWLKYCDILKANEPIEEATDAD